MTTATLLISLDVVCPQCTLSFDLIEREELNADGEMLKAACPDGTWHVEHEKFQEDVTCPECHTTFPVRGIEW